MPRIAVTVPAASAGRDGGGVAVSTKPAGTSARPARRPAPPAASRCHRRSDRLRGHRGPGDQRRRGLTGDAVHLRADRERRGRAAHRRGGRRTVGAGGAHAGGGPPAASADLGAGRVDHRERAGGRTAAGGVRERSPKRPAGRPHDRLRPQGRPHGQRNPQGPRRPTPAARWGWAKSGAEGDGLGALSRGCRPGRSPRPPGR